MAFILLNKRVQLLNNGEASFRKSGSELAERYYSFSAQKFVDVVGIFRQFCQNIHKAFFGRQFRQNFKLNLRNIMRVISLTVELLIELLEIGSRSSLDDIFNVMDHCKPLFLFSM